MSRTKPIHVPGMNPGDFPRLNPAIYQAMGTDNIFTMLENFYKVLEKSSIRDMFAQDMIAASKRSAAFYVQLLGGPSLYNEKYGNPMMRKRHFPFEITEEKRVIWVNCFFTALENATERYNFPEEELPVFKKWIEEFSRWMVNTKD